MRLTPVRSCAQSESRELTTIWTSDSIIVPKKQQCKTRASISFKSDSNLPHLDTSKRNSESLTDRTPTRYRYISLKCIRSRNLHFMAPAGSDLCSSGPQRSVQINAAAASRRAKRFPETQLFGTSFVTRGLHALVHVLGRIVGLPWDTNAGAYVSLPVSRCAFGQYARV